MISFELSVALAIAAGVEALLLAVIVLAAAPQRPANRLLAVALVVESVAASGARLSLILAPPWADWIFAVTPFAVTVVPFVYLSLLAVLHTPLVAWLRIDSVRDVLRIVGVTLGGLSIMTVAGPGRIRTEAGAATVPMALWASAVVVSVYALLLLVLLFALVAALDAVRRADPESAHRGRARAFLFSFGVRDALWSLGLALIIAGGVGGGTLIGRAQAPLVMLGEAVARLGTVLAIPIIAYGILQTQLFDIDLRLRWGIKRGSLVGIFVLVFFMASKIVESYLSQAAGWAAGSVAAGLLLFAAPRLNKLTERVAEAALPGVQPSSEYLTYRKLQVYQAAVESALETGPIDVREREMLRRLGAKLGLKDADRTAVETEVTEAKAVAAASTA